MRLHPLGEGWVHDRLAGGTNSYGLRQLRLPTPRYPGNLGGKVRDVFLLFLQGSTRDKDGKVAVLYAKALDGVVEERYTNI